MTKKRPAESRIKTDPHNAAGVSVVPRSGVRRGGDLLLDGVWEDDCGDEADEGEERAVHEDARGGPPIRGVVRAAEDSVVDQ